MMKKIMTLLAGAALFVVTGSAWAIPTTWVDTISFNNQLLTQGNAVTYTHDINDNGFIPLHDIVTSYSLTVDLNLKNTTNTKASIILPPYFISPDVKSYNFSYEDNTYGVSFWGLLQLNTTGTFTVSIYDGKGSFFLEDSILTANGCDNTPVPEPGTMVLLGAGLLGLAIFGKRRMNKS